MHCISPEGCKPRRVQTRNLYLLKKRHNTLSNYCHSKWYTNMKVADSRRSTQLDGFSQVGWVQSLKQKTFAIACTVSLNLR